MMLQSSAYLTIDDSASERMNDLVSYLEGSNIPALFFCRGDMLDQNSDAAIRAVQKGFVLANHTYSHRRSSEEDLAWFIADIELCESRLEEIYRQAGVTQPAKFFRFPHVDRGTGGWIVDYDAYEGNDRETVINAFAGGLNVKFSDRPNDAAFAKKQALQDYLKSAGYINPFKKITHDWFAAGEIASAHDCLYTYSNCDWMVTARHAGKWPYKNVADLKEKALSDPALTQKNSVNVILAHDQAEIVDVTIDLIKDLADNGLKFLEV